MFIPTRDGSEGSDSTLCYIYIKVKNLVSFSLYSWTIVAKPKLKRNLKIFDENDMFSIGTNDTFGNEFTAWVKFILTKFQIYNARYKRLLAECILLMLTLETNSKLMAILSLSYRTSGFWKLWHQTSHKNGISNSQNL